MQAILITGGVGDAIAIESLMQEEERKSVRCIFYATRAHVPCTELFTNLPSFPNLKNQAILWKDFSKIFGFNIKQHLVDKLCAYQPDDLQRTVKKLVERIDDWSIAKIFQEKRKYTYSSFVKYDLANIRKFNLPEHYYCICPYSNNDKRDNGRDYNEQDWINTLKILKDKGLCGVVINNGNEFIPDDKAIISLNNKTTIREAIEVIKNAEGYIGIDTAFSVIAAKTCNPTNILIKSINAHCYQWAHIYYAPLGTFNFIKREIKDQ